MTIGQNSSTIHKALLVALCFIGLTACKPSSQRASEDQQKALLDQGYTPQPRLFELKERGGGQVLLIGETTPNGRVRFLQKNSALGFTADSKGRFEAELTLGAQGDLFELSVDDKGRLIKVEGKLFIDPKGHAIALRPGTAQQAQLGGEGLISGIDHNGGPLIVISGLSRPAAEIKLSANGQPIGRVTAQSDGHYVYETQLDLTQAYRIEASDGATQQAITMPADPEGDPVVGIMAIDGGYAITWALDGGGFQTSLIYRP